MPGYMEQLLEELGWHQGTRVPLANEANKKLETILINRQQEIQRLKEATIQQSQKQADLDRYRSSVVTETQENAKLLVVQKQQLEAEAAACDERRRLREQVSREATRAARDAADVRARVDRLQNDTARLLKRADGLKSEVCGERGALDEWRAALGRTAADIGAVEMFNKQDLSKAKELETRRGQLKGERDRLHERLMQLCSNLAADERAAETLSGQVDEARDERTRVMLTWAAAVENLRQRDKDIRHTKEDYGVLEQEASELLAECREKQQFAEQLATDNAEGEREAAALAQRLSRARRDHAERRDTNLHLHTHVTTLQRVLTNLQRMLHELRAHNRHAGDEQRRVADASAALTLKLRELKEKKLEAQDKTRSAAARAKQLENMLAEEEKYSGGLSLSQERAMHCSYNQRQRLLALQEQTKLARVAFRSIRASMTQLDAKQQEVERLLQSQKETLYLVCYQVETLGARVAHMEGAREERDCDSRLVAREARLQQVCALHTARVALLSTHADKLRDEMRRLARDIARQAALLEQLQNGVRSRTVGAEGRRAALRDARDALRRARVEESLLKLRVAHSSRAVANLDNAAFGLHAQRLQMDAAMNERRVEVSARLDLFSVQKRSVSEDCGQLRCDIRERQQRIEQLKKRYDIFIASLGKDESGQQLSVTFFKIKFASERAELRARGAELDADIERGEGEVAALEASLGVMRAAHAHFVHHVSPLKPEDSEIQELAALSYEYYSLHGALCELRGRLAQQQESVPGLRAQHQLLADKAKELRDKRADAESEWAAARARLARQEERLGKAAELVRAQRRRVRKLLPDPDQWRYFVLETRCRQYGEGVQSALRQLHELAAERPALAGRLAALLTTRALADRLPRPARRCHALLARLSNCNTHQTEPALSRVSSSRASVTTERSSRSAARGGEHSAPRPRHPRLAAFRTRLADKLREEKLLEDDVSLSTSQSTLSVVTLGLAEPAAPDTRHQPRRP